MLSMAGYYDTGHSLNNQWGGALASNGMVFDTTGQDGQWLNGLDRFAYLLDMGISAPPPPSDWESQGFRLNMNVNHLLNHDSFDSSSGYCSMNTDPKNRTTEYTNNTGCEPNYKFGQQFNLLQLYTLAWPLTRTLKLCSTFAFQEKAIVDGYEMHAMPPVVDESDKARSLSLPIGAVDATGHPSRCKRTPTITPSDTAWDADPATPWVCEHRFDGVAGLVRFRKSLGFLGLGNITEPWTDSLGHIAYSVADHAFVALSRGLNSLSGFGSEDAFDLTGVKTSMAKGIFCDLGSQSAPLPPPGGWAADADAQSRCEQRVEIGGDGRVLSGILKAGHVVAISKDYTFT